MKHISNFKLTGQVKRALETNGYLLTCRRCGNPLQVGEKVVSKRSNWTSKVAAIRRAYYHKSCWDSMFME